MPQIIWSLAGLAAFFVATASFLSAAVAAPNQPATVDAIYRISFNGFHLGSFEFHSTVSGRHYALSGRAELSALLGAFKWRGNTSSSGSVRSGYPLPSAYAFNFKSHTKRGDLVMNFAHNKVTKVAARPPIKPSRGRVPVRRQHLTSVLDPLSAIMAITAVKGGKFAIAKPCKRTIKVFDGKQRFNLVFSPKNKVKLNKASRGFSGIAHVCRIQYVPIAGHKMNRETKYMAHSRAIEIWLVPAPRARIFVPYHIVLPTVAGFAAITARRVHIDIPGHERIALVR